MKIKKVLSRFYVHDIDKAIEFYEKIFDEKCSMKFDYPEMNLKLASVGNVLIIAGCDEALKKFKDTNATFLVDYIDELRTFLLNNGAEIIRDLKEVPSGKNMTVKHLDGTIVEYVEHKANFLNE